jgi:FMN phosphatase YigB (HAD superfamily)
MQYQALFFDIDDTLLDYRPCCRQAFDYAMRCLISNTDDELFELFFDISGRLFEQAKHGHYTIAQVMELYPEQFIQAAFARRFSNKNTLRSMTDTFKHAFRLAWGQTHTLVPGAHGTLVALRNKGYRLYAASNSFGHLQRQRLRLAGLLELFDNTFISIDIGYDKPDIRFFRYVMAQLPPTGSTPLMIGDSITSDIIGAKNAGWHTCFFNRYAASSPDAETDYEIHALPELLNFL